MFVPRASPLYRRSPRAPPPTAGGAIRDRHHALGVGPLGERVDVVGEQARVAGQDAGERLVDRPEQRVDRAVALGRGLPLVIAGGDDDGAAAAGRSSPT